MLTPHIGGIAGFYRIEGESLNLVAQQDGVTSHPVFSRNPDMGLAGNRSSLFLTDLSERSPPCAGPTTGWRSPGKPLSAGKP